MEYIQKITTLQTYLGTKNIKESLKQKKNNAYIITETLKQSWGV